MPVEETSVAVALSGLPARAFGLAAVLANTERRPGKASFSHGVLHVASSLAFSALHADAENFCLVTHTQAARAISMYLQVGFVPTGLGPDNQTPDGRAEMTAEELAGWAAMREAGLELPEYK